VTALSTHKIIKSWFNLIAAMDLAVQGGCGSVRKPSHTLSFKINLKNIPYVFQ
jgi:hypothetical protein